MIFFFYRKKRKEKEKNLKNEISSMALAKRIRTLACACRHLRANLIPKSISENRTKKDDTWSKKDGT